MSVWWTVTEIQLIPSRCKLCSEVRYGPYSGCQRHPYVLSVRPRELRLVIQHHEAAMMKISCSSFVHKDKTALFEGLVSQKSGKVQLGGYLSATYLT